MGNRGNPTSKSMLFPQSQDSQSEVLGPAAGARPGDSLETQIPRPSRRPTESEAGLAHEPSRWGWCSLRSEPPLLSTLSLWNFTRSMYIKIHTTLSYYKGQKNLVYYTSHQNNSDKESLQQNFALDVTWFNWLTLDFFIRKKMWKLFQISKYW